MAVWLGAGVCGVGTLRDFLCVVFGVVGLTAPRLNQKRDPLGALFCYNKNVFYSRRNLTTK